MSALPVGILLFLMFGTTTVVAQEEESCDDWTAGLSQEEEGEVMMASGCVRHAESYGWVSLKCGPDGLLWFSYQSGVQGALPQNNYGSEFDGGYRNDFKITAVDREVVMKMHLYAMYGDIGGTFDPKGSLGTLIREGGSFTIQSADGFYPPETFTLSRAGEAMAEVERSCSR
jgi:hypothetical protein